ncbi:MAG: hypothetical protein IE927_13585 [Rhodobacterales bacterium]|nr:hypothetical protein [Rhodobacterales bacterium]
MTDLSHAAPRGLIFRLPLIGRIARDIDRDISNVWYALVILLTWLVVGVQTWGFVALAMTALAFVPVILVVLILISRG